MLNIRRVHGYLSNTYGIRYTPNRASGILMMGFLVWTSLLERVTMFYQLEIPT